LRPRHARGAFALLAIAALALTCDNALAAAGGLDPAFDADGKRVLPTAATPRPFSPSATATSSSPAATRPATSPSGA
jgi:hypothetical protein